MYSEKEPLMPSEVPEVPWSCVTSDIFEFERDSYLVPVDYYSKYIEVSKLGELSSLETIKVLKEHFGRHGVSSKLITDCGSQYANKKFGSFAESYNSEHVLVSPKHSKANGEVEAAVKTVKSLWRKNKDKNKALLDYRATSKVGLVRNSSHFEDTLLSELGTLALDVDIVTVIFFFFFFSFFFFLLFSFIFL